MSDKATFEQLWRDERNASASLKLSCSEGVRYILWCLVETVLRLEISLQASYAVGDLCDDRELVSSGGFDKREQANLHKFNTAATWINKTYPFYLQNFFSLAKPSSLTSSLSSFFLSLAGPNKV